MKHLTTLAAWLIASTAGATGYQFESIDPNHDLRVTWEDVEFVLTHWGEAQPDGTIYEWSDIEAVLNNWDLSNSVPPIAFTGDNGFAVSAHFMDSPNGDSVVLQSQPVTGDIPFLSMTDPRRTAEWWLDANVTTVEEDLFKKVTCGVNVYAGFIGTDSAYAAGGHPDTIAAVFPSSSHYYSDIVVGPSRAQGLFIRINEAGYYAEHGAIPGVAVIRCSFPRHIDREPGATKPRSNSQILYPINHLVIRDTTFDYLIIKHDVQHPVWLFNVDFENVRCRLGWSIDPTIIPLDSPLRDQLILDPGAP